MKAYLSFIIILLSLFTFSQKTQNERGDDPPECIKGPSTHIVGETKSYSYGGLLLAGQTPVYTWTQLGTANVTFTYPNPSNKKNVNVTLNTPGTLCLKVSISYLESIQRTECSECFETCDLEGMLDFHDEIEYNITGFQVIFSPTNYNTPLYDYNWIIFYNNGTTTGGNTPQLTLPLPYCGDRKIVRAILEACTKDNCACKAKLEVVFDDPICSNVLPPDDKSGIDVVIVNSALKVMGENIENYNIMIYDTNSKLILNSVLKSEMNLFNLKSGTYFYKIIGENNLLIKDGSFIKN